MQILEKIKSLFTRNSGTKATTPVNDFKLGALIALIIAVISASGLFQKYELSLLDEMFRIRGEQKSNDNIAIIQIEDKSLEVLGRWPWPRTHHADFLRMIVDIAKPKAIAFDILFPEADLEGDGIFADEIKKAGNVYLLSHFDLAKKPLSLPQYTAALKKMPQLEYSITRGDKFLQASSVTLPVPVLANAAKAIAFANVEPDIDGSTRRVPLVIKFNNALYPTLGLQLACYYLGAGISDVKIGPHALTIPLENGLIRVPMDESGCLILNYSGPIDTFQSYSYLFTIQDYYIAMDGGESKIIKHLKDKVLFVGHTATGTVDSRIMPFSNTYPAVGVHATVLSNILNRNFMSRAPLSINISVVLFSGIFLGLLLRRGRKAVANLSIMAAMFIIYSILSFALFAFFDFWMNVFAPLATIVLTYVGITVNQYSAIRYEKKLLENELLIARAIQQSFLPKGYPQTTSLEVAAKCLPAKHIGGDLYDFITLEDGRVGVVIGDVSGKGVPAALYMARTISQFRTTAQLNKDPAETLKMLNDAVSKEGMEKSFITMQYITIGLHSKEFLFSNGGHNTILHLIKDSRKIEELDTEGGMPIGVMEGIDFYNRQVPMAKGDILFLYSDGISEAMDKNHKEFGLNRVKDILLANCESSAGDIMQKVLDEIEIFAKGAPQHDDMTVIVIKAV